jgi:hypothetical protein
MKPDKPSENLFREPTEQVTSPGEEPGAMERNMLQGAQSPGVLYL